MLKINIPSAEYYNSSANEFIKIKGGTIILEHSLLSISKWESKWHKPFSSKDQTTEERLDYIKCMTITQNVRPELYYNLNDSILSQIDEYINDSMTATWFNDSHSQNSKKFGVSVVTSELIYYWMTTYNIPFECEKWHLNRLLTLIRVCMEKNSPPKKMGRQEQAKMQSELNAKRRAAMKSRG